MVKITNGLNTYEVTRGAYLSVYAHQGYKLVADAPAQAEAVAPTADNADDAFIEALLEKPISQWSKGDVKRYATITGVDISGTKNVNEAKELIKEHLESSDAE